MDQLIIGIKGFAVCLDKKTGDKLWETKLKSTSGVTNICVDGDDVFAYSGGYLFCLDQTTGAIKWENGLEGFGYGPCIFATENQAAAATSSQANKYRGNDDLSEFSSS